MAIMFFVALINLGHAADNLPMSPKELKFIERREAITRALMVLQFAEWQREKPQQVARAELEKLGLNAKEISVLNMTLGGYYSTPLPEFPTLTRAVPITTAQYDKAVSKVTRAMNLGPDYLAYLRSQHPELLQGRLKSIDALEPKLIHENIPIFKALVKNNLWPNEGLKIDHHKLLQRNIERAAPILWKDETWRNSMRELLVESSPSELRKVAGAVALGSGHYQTLSWGLPDVFVEATKAVGESSEKDIVFSAMKSAFPADGASGIAQNAIAPLKPNLLLSAKGEVISTYQRSTLDGLEKVDRAALSEFYTGLKKEFSSPRGGTFDSESVKRLLKWVTDRAKETQFSIDDAELIEAILPRASAVALEDRYFNPVRDMREIEEQLLHRRHLTANDRSYIASKLASARVRAANQPELANAVLKLLRSTDPTEITQGLTEISKSGLGIGHAEIQQRLSELARETASGKSKAPVYFEELKSAIFTVLEPGSSVEGSLIHQAFSNDAIGGGKFNQDPKAFVRSRLEGIKAGDIRYDSALFESLAFRQEHIKNNEWASGVMTQLLENAPSEERALIEHLKNGDDVAQKFVIELLNSDDPERIARGLNFCITTPVGQKSAEIQRRLVVLYPRIRDLPTFGFRGVYHEKWVIEDLFGKVVGRGNEIVDPGLVKFLFALPESDGKKLVLERMNAEHIPYDAELLDLVKSYDPKSANFQKTLAYHSSISKDDAYKKTVTDALQKKAPWKGDPVGRFKGVIVAPCAEKFASIWRALRSTVRSPGREP